MTRALRSRKLVQDPEHGSDDEGPRTASRSSDDTPAAKQAARGGSGGSPAPAVADGGRAYGRRLAAVVAAIFILGPELFQYTLVTTMFRYGIAAGEEGGRQTALGHLGGGGSCGAVNAAFIAASIMPAPSCPPRPSVLSHSLRPLSGAQFSAMEGRGEAGGEGGDIPLHGSRDSENGG